MAERLNVSRTPVREAFLRLQAEGLVISLQQRTTMVSRINMERVKQECFIREGLEHAVVRPFVAHCEPEDLRCLRTLNEMQRDYYRQEDWIRVLECDQKFHETFFDVARQPLGWALINNNNGHYDRARMLAIRAWNISEEIYRDHTEMVDQLEQRNIREVQNLIYQHVYGKGKVNPAFLIMQEYPEYVSENDADAAPRIGRL